MKKTFAPKDLFIGIPSHMWNEVIGKKASKNFKINEKITI